MRFELGDFKISIVSGGRFRLDGGAMFGVVPKPLWERVAPPDSANRIAMDTNCVFVETPDHRVLIDTGYGPQLTSKELEHNAVPAFEPSLVDNLKGVGVTPDQIDIVVFSHLHFDHAGGASVVGAGGSGQLAFPNAAFAVQKLEWADSISDAPEIAGTYLRRDIRPLIESGKLALLDGAAEIVPGIRVEPTGAHTPGHQIIRVESRHQQAVYLGDLCPTANHMRTFWTMGYDQFPRETRRLKPQILGQCADNETVVLFDHEPRTPAVRIIRDSKREFVVAEVLATRHAIQG